MDSTLIIKLKLVLLGKSNVGKTCMMFRYCENTFKGPQSTIGVAFINKTVTHENTMVHLHIWDTGGGERFRAISKLYYRDAAGAIIVYDITDRKSLDSAQEWIQELRDQNPNIQIILAGNKVDLETAREVSYQDGINLASANNVDFLETSAKSGVHVDDIFEKLVSICMQRTGTPDSLVRGSTRLGEEDGDNDGEDGGCSC